MHRRNFHLVGIGGSGMSALARLLHESGHRVSGSDHRDGERLDALRRLGIPIRLGHVPEHIRDADRVVTSPAIPAVNPELLYARRLGIATRTRAAALADLLSGRSPICVAGSHGKTTTSSMLALILDQAGQAPGFMIGGESPALGGVNARLGPGAPFVLEACEAFRALEHWQPGHCILTNVDDEHSDHYGGVPELNTAFAGLLERVPATGRIVLCGDDPGARSIARSVKHAVIRYGLDPGNDLCALQVASQADGSHCEVTWRGEHLGRLRVPVPGLHNLRNALGATALALELGIPFSRIAQALGGFIGVDRRWQYLGETNGIRVFNDFAHHPREIEAVLDVARQARTSESRVVVVCEPQLYSRVGRLVPAFAEALAAADLLFLLPVDGVGEARPPEDVDTRLASACREQGVATVRLPDLEAALAALGRVLRPGDLLLTLGPGQVGTLGPRLLAALGESRDVPRPADAAPAWSQAEGPDVPLPGHPHLLEAVFHHGRERPEALAVECGELRWSYRELLYRADALAERLREAGTGPGQVVAVSLGRSARRIASFLAVALADAVYLPVDPRLPPERIRFMLKDARVRIALVDAETRPLFAPLDLQTVPVDTEPASGPALPAQRAALQEPAYLIYTSGSTGQPKGVVIEHAALFNFARSAAVRFGVGPESRVSQASSFGFDVAVGDMAMALYAGASLVVPEESEAPPGLGLARFIADRHVTHLSLTPSALSVVPLRDFPALSHVIVAGEACPPDLVQRWGEGRRFFNAYGPTEATILATAAECRPGQPVDIGQPLDNMGILVLDETLHPVPRGTRGELWLTGAGLAREYLGRPELTAERFRDLHLPDGTTRRAYRTGDLAILDLDGRLHYAGRLDDQIKLRGYRIELGEITTALRLHPGIADAAVAVRQDAAGRDQLVAYVVPAANGAPLAAGLVRDFLARRLPSYMVPARVVFLAAIPLSPNGKQDRAALPDPGPEPTPAPAPVHGEDALEARLLGLLREELRLPDLQASDRPLRDLGLDSLAAAGFFIRIEERIAAPLPPEALSTEQTLADLAGRIRALNRAPSTTSSPGSLVEEIRRRQLGYVSAWGGLRRSPSALVATRNETGRQPPLFWCFQGKEEHEQLARHLPDRPLHGMRSGHLVFRYTEDNLQALASLYADELTQIQPGGPFLLGGNCQGGTIARALALELARRGRQVALLILMEQVKFPDYPAPVALIFGRDSHTNPHVRMTDPEQVFRAAYPAGYSVDVVPGKHGSFFLPPQIQALARCIEVRLAPHGAATAAPAPQATPPLPPATITSSRNQPCPCGSGKRYKHCCGQDAAPPAALPLRERALAAHRRGALGEAEALYREALAANPEDLDVRHMLGVLLMQRWKNHEALECLWQCAERSQWSVPDIRHNLTLLLSRLLAAEANRIRQGILDAVLARETANAPPTPPGSPLVSVVLGVQRPSLHLTQAIGSVLAQTWRPLELVVVDTTPPLHMEGVLSALPAPADLPIRPVHCPGLNKPSAMNAGAQQARGEFLAFLEPDDVFAPERLARLVEHIPRAGHLWGFSEIDFVDEAGQPDSSPHALAHQERHAALTSLFSHSFALLKHDLSGTTGNLFIQRDLFHQLGGFRDLGDLYFDHDLDLRLRASALSEPVIVPGPLYARRLAAGEAAGPNADAASAGREFVLRDLLEGVLDGTTACTNPLAPHWPANRPLLFRMLLKTGQGNLLPPSILRALVEPLRTVLATQPENGGTSGPRHAIVVLGMHRSGTSALTRVLNLCGAHLPDAVLPGMKRNNPTGFWEPEDVILFNENLLKRLGGAWNQPEFSLPTAGPLVEDFMDEAVALIRTLYGTASTILIKDPRICLLAPLWHTALENAGYRPLYVVPVRNPLDVAHSLHARGDMSVEAGLHLWSAYWQRIEAFTAAQGDVILVDYDELLDDWRRVVRRITERFPLDLDTVANAERIDAFLNPALRHQCHPEDAWHRFMAGADVAAAVRDQYRRLTRQLRDGHPPADAPAPPPT